MTIRRVQTLLLIASLFSFSAHAEVLFDGWYTVMIGKSQRYGYYHDRATVEEGQLRYLNEYWKSEEGFVNEEKLGTVAKYSETLDPIFFNFHSKYRKNETNVDGTVGSDRRLSVKIKKNGEEPVPKARGLSKDTIFSSQFPVWLGKRLSKMKPGKSLMFQVLLEDGQDKDFSPVDAKAALETADAFAKSNHVQRVSVSLDGQPSTWYVKANGLPIKILMPKAAMEVKLVSEKEAKDFLGQ